MTDGNDLAGISFNDRGAITHGGLTKRELFAAMAMQGMLAYGENTYDPCVYAASYADRLIAELNKGVQS